MIQSNDVGIWTKVIDFVSGLCVTNEIRRVCDQIHCWRKIIICGSNKWIVLTIENSDHVIVNGAVSKEEVEDGNELVTHMRINQV